MATIIGPAVAGTGMVVAGIAVLEMIEFASQRPALILGRCRWWLAGAAAPAEPAGPQELEAEAAQVRGVAANSVRNTCEICFDMLGTEAAACCQDGHFLCFTCMRDHIGHESGMLGQMPRRADGEVQCPGRSRQSRCTNVIKARDILAHGDDVFQMYIHGRVLANSKEIPPTTPKASPQLSGCNAVRAFVQHIRESILTPSCPRCNQVFVDFDGCVALTCHRCKAEFCGLCFADCGSDAHQHVRLIHPHIDLFLSAEEWRRRLLTWQQQQMDALFERVRSEAHAVQRVNHLHESGSSRSSTGCVAQ